MLGDLAMGGALLMGWRRQHREGETAMDVLRMERDDHGVCAYKEEKENGNRFIRIS